MAYDKEAKRAYDAARYAANKEAVKARVAAWRKSHPERPVATSGIPNRDFIVDLWQHGDETTRNDLELRWRSHIRWPENEDGCWEWDAALLPSGYGSFRIKHRTIGAHRFAWLTSHGELPADLFICHHCDNPRCVRPTHLYAGTPADNAHDRVRRGRSNPPTGDRHGTRTKPGSSGWPRKLTPAQVEAIQAEWAAGVPGPEIAARYGVDRSYPGKLAKLGR
jgi:hypothetical protein